mgnify:CR=1 FL=1
MSWFKRRPRTKEPEKLFPHHSSPFAEKALEEAKERAKPLRKKAPKPK